MINFKAGLVAFLIMIATHYAAYYQGSKKPAQIVNTETVRTDIVTQIKEVVKADGSKEIQTIIVDKSKESTSTKTPVFAPKPDWVVGTYYRLNDPTYALSVSYRIIGPLSASVFGDFRSNLYLGATIEF